MNRLFKYTALLLILALTLTSCSFINRYYSPEVSVNEDGYVVVNGSVTDILAAKDDVITVDEEGYLVVNGVKTEYKVEQHTDDNSNDNNNGNDSNDSENNEHVLNPNNVLVIESIEHESDAFVDTLTLDSSINVTVLKIDNTELMPKTIDELVNYGTVILFNISNEQLSLNVGFDELLKTYVHDIGGGLFTVCGNKETPDAGDEWTTNAYTRADMIGTVYQNMLPVEIVDYTDPVGVIIILDSSGSMLGNTFEQTKFYSALNGVRACLDALTERDYIGITTLSDSYTEVLELTPRTQTQKIIDCITELEEAGRKNVLPGGGTLFSPALERAGIALAALTDIEKRHIIVITDGQPSSDDQWNYRYSAEENAKRGITMSIVGIGVEPGSDAQDEMEDLLVNYAGCKAENFHMISNNNYLEELPNVMRQMLKCPEIKSVNYDTFKLKTGKFTSITAGLDEDKFPTLDGYYGVKLKDSATSVLEGEYTPIYSQWQYGKGRVGTFACDLNGTWSEDFISSDEGKVIINYIILWLSSAID